MREVKARTLGREAQFMSDNKEKWEVSQLLFADNTVLVEDSKENLERLVNELGRVCNRKKQKVNAAKNKAMQYQRWDV
mgnify:CR=1 FL=1